MSVPGWQDELRRLLGRVLEAGRAIPRGAFDEWLAEAAETRRSRVASERAGSGMDVYALDVAEALRPDGDVWLDRDPGEGRFVRVGYDADGVLAVAAMHDRDDEAGAVAVAVGDRDRDGTDVVIGRWTWHQPRVTACRQLDDGAVVLVSAEWSSEIDGEGLLQVVAAITEPAIDGRARVRRVRMLPSHRPGDPGSVVGGADELVLDPAGRPIERWIDRTARWDAEGGKQPSEIQPPAVPLTDPAALLELAFEVLERRASTPTPVLWWSARLNDPPWTDDGPVAVDDEWAIESAAIGLRDAVVRAAATATLPAPCAVQLQWWTGDTRRPPALPELTVVDRAFRDGFSRLPVDHHPLHRIHDALAAGEAQRFALGPFADDPTLEVWRRLQRAYPRLAGVTKEERTQAAQQLARVRRRTLSLLLEHHWPPHWDPMVLPWLWFGPSIDGDGSAEDSVEPVRELRELAPRAAELDALWPVRPPRAAESWSSLEDDEGQGDDEDELLAEAVTSRAALRELLRREGLASHAAALAHAARWGWALQASSDEPAGLTARSRIGGRPLLPPCTAWPTTDDGQPLTFIAAIDLAEARRVPEPVPLPPDGVLLVYVLVGEFDPEEGALAFVEHEPASETAIVFHVPADTVPVTVETPSGPLLHRQEPGGEPADPVDEPLALRPVLMPELGEEQLDRVGLHPSELDRYQQIAWDLIALIEGPDDGLDDQHGHGRMAGTLLGAEAGVQGVGVEDDEIVLLAIAPDANVGLEWGDGGDLRVLIDRQQAEAGRWDRAYAIGDSC